jgi:23S rRNA pseudouridine1911/1915/1917 synthase
MASIGHPVCGDQRYGGRGCGRALGLERQFLHSARLSFAHPVDGRPVDTSAALPDDLVRALAAAREEGRSGGSR